MKQVMLYSGRYTTNHLVEEGAEKTFCDSVDVEYNNKGEIKKTKSFKFKGRDRMLGSICTHCERAAEKQGLFQEVNES